MRTLFTRFLQNVRFYRSLKFRIFIIVLLIGIIPSVIVRLLMISSYRNRAMSQKTAEVTNQSAIVAAHLARTDYLSDPDNPVIDDELTQLSNLYDGRILVIDDTYRVIKDTYGKSQGRYIVSSEVISCMNGSRDMSSFDEVYTFFHKFLKLPHDEAHEQSIKFITEFPKDTCDRLKHIVKRTIKKRS